MTDKLTDATAVRKFFNMTLAEMKAEYLTLSKEDKAWFGEECRKALA